MPLIPQQDIVVITGPYKLAPRGSFQGSAVEKLKLLLESYPPSRVVAINFDGSTNGIVLTAVIETV